MIYRGDTVRLVANFMDFNGNAVSPENIELTIYDLEEEEIESINLDDSNRKDVGVYFYDYVADQDVIFEFFGEVEGNPTVIRNSLQVKFN